MPLQEGGPPGLHKADIEAVVVEAWRENGRWRALVWMRSATLGLGRYLAALEKVA